MKKYLYIILFVQFISSASFAQTKQRFWDDVQTIKKYDKIYAPPTNPILFIGSSSIRKWDDVELVFADYNALNRGLGGTITDEITNYLQDIVFPYKPRQIVLFVGENDLPSSTAPEILSKTVRLYNAIRAGLPNIPLVYISIKPSPVRDQYMDKAKETNRLIKDFFSKETNVVFVDIYSQMLSREGKSRPELFGPDMLHMNKDGYAIWEKAVRPYLLKKEK